MNTKRIEDAIAFALTAHDGQTRKGEETPYIVHPVVVALILAKHDFSDDVIIGGILHDVIEDTSVSKEDVASKFGEEVAELVTSVTHNGAHSWKEKKEKDIASVRTASQDAKAIATADKIANAQSLLNSHAVHGSAVWNRFNASREDKLWFEHTMLDMLEDSWGHPLVGEYRALVEKLDALV